MASSYFSRSELHSPQTSMYPTEQIEFLPAPVAERLSFISLPGSLSHKRAKHNIRYQLQELFKRNVGLSLICISQLFGSCMGACVQLLNRRDPPISPAEILVFRQSLTFTSTYLYMKATGVPDPLLGPREIRPLLVIRGVSGFLGVFSTYTVLKYLSLSDATVLTFVSPFFTSFAGTFILGESFSIRNFGAGIFSMIGVLLIARPEALFGTAFPSENSEAATSQRIVAVGIAMLGVLGATGAYISLRAIGKRSHVLHNMNYFAFFSGFIALILLFWDTTNKPVIPYQWQAILLLLAISIFGFGAQMMLMLGLRRETASRGSLAIYSQIIFAHIIEQALFHTELSILSLIGTLIILASGLYVVLTKEATDVHKAADGIAGNLGNSSVAELDSEYTAIQPLREDEIIGCSSSQNTSAPLERIDLTYISPEENSKTLSATSLLSDDVNGKK